MGCGAAGAEQERVVVVMSDELRRVTVSFQRGDLTDVFNLFDGASVLQAGPHDDRDATKQAAYWIGRNAARIQAAARRAGRQAQEIMTLSAAEDLYEKAREEIMQRFAKRDDRGDLVLVKAGPDREAYSFVGESEALCNAALAELREQHADAADAIAARLVELRAFLKEPVTLTLTSINFNMLPATMSGSYAVGIRKMLHNRPDELDLGDCGDVPDDELDDAE
jgi:hypothetical protein